MKPHYYTIPEMLQMIGEPNQFSCQKLYTDNIALFRTAAGSVNNHQAWEGGYHDHIEEIMNICILLYPVYKIRDLNFSLTDALLVAFLHDLEKPWRIEFEVDHLSKWPIRVIDKSVRKTFRDEKIKAYGIELNEQQQNALNYIEGENKDYSSGKRVMNELAAFCHIADISSARIWYGYPCYIDRWRNG